VAPGRILFADDDPRMRAMLSDLLAGAGFEVTPCENGRRAVEALGTGFYDAVLSDIDMPDMDGLALLRAIREQDLELPVLLYTGGPSVETAVSALDWGALEYLIKPVAPERLFKSLERAVKLGRLARLKREALSEAGLGHLAGDRAGLEASFARGLGSLWIAFQPIVRTSGEDLYGHEALLRTEEPQFPHPGAFLEAAERLGRLPELGRAIRAAVARQMTTTFPTGTVFVNLHPQDLMDEELLDPASPLSALAGRVILEITERASLDNVSEAGQQVDQLRRLGYGIAIDDLGAGYSGLTSFATLGPDIVKLDMGLIRDIDTSPVKQKLVESMARLCRDLGILVVAEGVETEAERGASDHAGSDLLKGSLHRKPSRLGTARTLHAV
jgi:EAL domain-containing protein (putative c-di-GMP-specific phosphodiesterase class I)